MTPYSSFGGSGALELQPVHARVPLDLMSIPGYQSADSWALSMQATPGGYYGLGFAYNAGGVNGHYFTWDIPLAAGTWSAEYYYAKGPSSGIATVSLDPPGSPPLAGGGQVLFTQDQYAAATALANYRLITGINVPNTGHHAIQISCTSKNASSTGFFLIYQRLNFVRTA